MSNDKKSVFETLAAVDCREHIEKKGNLSYLSWAWAWHYVKSHYPDASYTIYERPDGTPYFTDGKTCWVKTGVTIEGLEHIEYLPIMDLYNHSLPLDKVTSMDMNKAIQRSLTKAAARHGLGLFIYAGEDLPMMDDGAFKPMEQSAYLAVVAAAALGKKTKSGKDYRTEYQNRTNAGALEMQDFDDMVDEYKRTHGIA